MTIRAIRHSFNKSGDPDLAPDCGQGILKRRRGLGFIPWPVRKTLEIAVLDEPTPNQRIDGIPQGSDSFRPRAFPGLGLLNPQELLSVSEGIFDGPPVKIARDQSPRLHRQVGGEEEIVFLHSFGVPRDHQPNALSWHDSVPYHVADKNESFSFLPPLIGFDNFPIFGCCCNLFGGWQLLPLLPRPSSFSSPVFRRHFVNGRIMSNPADQVNSRRDTSGQRSIETVSDEVNQAIREPVHDFKQHFVHQVESRLSGIFIGPLPVEAHVDRQRKRFSTPRGANQQTQQDDLKAPGIYHPLFCRPNRIPARFGPFNLPASFLMDGVVAEDPDDVGMSIKAHDRHRKGSQEDLQAPFPGAYEAMVSIMRVLPLRISKKINRSDKPTTGAKNPAFEKILEKNLTWPSKNREELLYKGSNVRYLDHGRSSYRRVRLASHLHCSARTAFSGTGSYQNVRKSTLISRTKRSTGPLEALFVRFQFPRFTALGSRSSLALGSFVNTCSCR